MKWRKGRFLDENAKRHEKCRQAVHDQSLTMEKSWVTMMYQTDKEREEQEEACSTSEAWHVGNTGAGTYSTDPAKAVPLFEVVRLAM